MPKILLFLVFSILFPLSAKYGVIVYSNDSLTTTTKTAAYLKQKIIADKDLKLILRSELNDLAEEQNFSSFFSDSIVDSQKFFNKADFLLKIESDQCKAYDLRKNTLVLVKIKKKKNISVNAEVFFNDFKLKIFAGFNPNNYIKIVYETLILMDRYGSMKEFSFFPESFKLDLIQYNKNSFWLELKVYNGVINPYSLKIVSQAMVKRNPEKRSRFDNLNEGINFIYIRKVIE